MDPITRTDAQAQAILDAELTHLAPRREALGEAGFFAVAGWTLEHAMEWEAAAIAWRRALELDPRDSVACFHLGASLLEMSRFPDAADAFRRAIVLDAENPRIDWFDE